MEINDLEPKKDLSEEEMKELQGGVIPLPFPKVATTLGVASNPLTISSTATSPVAISNEPVYRPKA